jgi:hypothetical protein
MRAAQLFSFIMLNSEVWKSRILTNNLVDVLLRLSNKTYLVLRFPLFYENATTFQLFDEDRWFGDRHSKPFG